MTSDLLLYETTTEPVNLEPVNLEAFTEALCTIGLDDLAVRTSDGDSDLRGTPGG